MNCSVVIAHNDYSVDCPIRDFDRCFSSQFLNCPIIHFDLCHSCKLIYCSIDHILQLKKDLGTLTDLIQTYQPPVTTTLPPKIERLTESTSTILGLSILAFVLFILVVSLLLYIIPATRKLITTCFFECFRKILVCCCFYCLKNELRATPNEIVFNRSDGPIRLLSESTTATTSDGLSTPRENPLTGSPLGAKKFGDIP